MKIVLKNLKQVAYEVEVASEKVSILDLKKEIEKVHGFDASQLKLLHNGVVLDNLKTLEDYKIQEQSIIIMMNSKVKPKNLQPSTNVESSQTQKTSEQKKTEQKKLEEKKPSDKHEQKQQTEKYTQQINSLIEMGFEKSQAEAAINAAHGQIDLAIEFLYNGIPEGINNDLNDLDIDVDEEQGEYEGEEGEDNNDEDPVKNVASVAKVLCRNNPGALNELLQSIQQSDPDLLNLINEREDDFKSFLEQPINDNDYRVFQKLSKNMGLGGDEEGHEEHDNDDHDSGQISINLTPQEQEAIKRLKDLGNFSEADVVQAYFACDKNEELTANYLFEQKMREDDEMFGGNNNNNGNGQ